MSDITAYPPLTDSQIAVVLRTALNPNNRFLPVNDPIRIPFLMRLFLALVDIQRVTKRPYGGLLDEIIHSNTEILHIGCPTVQLRGDTLWHLGTALSDRFDENGIKKDLEDSINAFRDCLAIANYSKPRWIRLYMLGNHQAKLCFNFDSTNSINETISTLDECLKLYSEMFGIDIVSDQTSDDMWRLSEVRNDLGHLHLKRLRFHSKSSLQVTSGSEVGPCTGTYDELVEDLNIAIFNFEEHNRLLRLCNRPIPWATRGSLATCYDSRFDMLGDRTDIEKSVALCRIAMSESSPNDDSYPGILSDLAERLHTKYNAYRHSEDLHEAILHIEKASELRPDNTIYRTQRAQMYQFRFRITNDVGDLDAAISETRKCVDSNTLQGSNQVLAMRQLARSLEERFKITRALEDLEEAIKIVMKFADKLRPGITTRSISDDWLVFCEYGGLLFRKFEVTGNIDDLHESHCQYEVALRLVPYHSIHRRTLMHNYANLLARLYENTDKVEHLNKSIDLYREAYHLYEGKNVDNLYLCGASLVRRVEHTYKRTNRKLPVDENANRDLEDALKYLRDAGNLVHPNHPAQSQIQALLAVAYSLKDGTENQQIAFSLFERAVKHITATPRDCLHAGQNWITNSIKLQDFEEATRAYGHTMDTLYRFLSTNPTVASQQQLINLRRPDNLLSRTFASDAAYTAIRAGNPTRAVELLEQGRGLLWSRLNHYQYPLDRLKDTEPILAKKYKELSKKLENLAISPANLEVRRATDKMMEELHVASKEWDEVVDQIRKLDGFSDFHKPLRYDLLRRAATDGPVIIINVSVRHGHSDAIIIRNEGDLVIIPLPDATPDRIVEYCTTLVSSLETLVGRKFRVPSKQYGRTWWQSANHSNTRDDSEDDSDDEDEKEVEIQRTNLRHVLRFLWNSIVQPVVEKLHELSIQPGSRIWWCPTTFTCTFPLHAAGPYKEGEQNLSDLYISSYLGCLSNSHYVRQATNPSSKCQPPTTHVRLLAINCPGDPNEEDFLASVEGEVEEVRRCFSFMDTSLPKVLDGPQANVESVIASLPQYSWVHFTCHGNQHPEPFRSSFKLYGGEKITLLHLMQARNPDAELAFLSACDTAAGDIVGTPDEVIHLVSTLQFIGFKSVIGTLWPMYDADGPDLAGDFYGYLLGEGKGDYRMSAVALHEATKKMRERDVPLERWVNFVHFGA